MEHVVGLWEETEVPGENKGNMPTPHRKNPSWDLNWDLFTILFALFGRAASQETPSYDDQRSCCPSKVQGAPKLIPAEDMILFTCDAGLYTVLQSHTCRTRAGFKPEGERGKPPYLELVGVKGLLKS